MTEPIQPALTPEEWAETTSDPDHAVWPPDSLWYDLSGRSPTSSLAAAKHAVAADALHGQPFGFTWEDVRMLREAADTEVDDGFPPGAYAAPLPESAALHNLADRIAALLPPEES